MSDGPHRSLKMPRGWKKLAERADREACEPEEVRDALLEALEEDWRKEVPISICRRVRDILGDSRSSLLGDRRGERFEAVREETAGYTLGSTVVDFAIHAAARGRYGDEAWLEATSKALMDRVARGARQVEEHYYRKSTPQRATRVRERVGSAATQADIDAVAGRLAGIDKSKSPPPTKQTGLDDGVRL